MRPDDQFPMPPFDADPDLAGLGLPADVDLAPLEAELTAAGARARRGSPAAPTRAFAARLRTRLLSAYEAAPVVAATAGRATSDSPSTRAHGFVAAPAAGVRGTGWRAPQPEPVVNVPRALQGRLVRRTPSFLPAPRWSILAVAAAVVVAVAGLNGTFLRPALADSRVAAAVGATLIRAGQPSALGAGTALLAGDEIRVSPGGSASLQLGDSRARLAAGADIRLTALARADIELNQLAGRAWHRVALPPGGQYQVTTGDVHWTAAGTAFDIDRTIGPAGDIVHELSVEHAVTVDGPGLRVSVAEGQGATVVLGAAPTVATVVVPTADVAADPWLRGNALSDLAAGYDIGMLEGVDLGLAEATSTPREAVASPEPTATPSATDGPTPAPTAEPTARPTARPTSRPTIQPTPKPTLGTMGLSALACPGAIEFGWTLPDLGGLHHVQVLRGSSSEIPVGWPPASGVVAFDSGYVAGGVVRTAFDAGLDAGAHAWYRAIAFDADSRPLAASGVLDRTMVGTVGLGTLSVTAGPEAGQVQFSWAPFTGSGDCFSFYKIVASADDPTPSYLTGATLLAALSDQSASGATVGGLSSGQSLWFRVQAIREAGSGKFVAAETDPVQFTVP